MTWLINRFNFPSTEKGLNLYSDTYDIYELTCSYNRFRSDCRASLSVCRCCEYKYRFNIHSQLDFRTLISFQHHPDIDRVWADAKDKIINNKVKYVISAAWSAEIAIIYNFLTDCQALCCELSIHPPRFSLSYKHCRSHGWFSAEWQSINRQF